ncbi:hypothetical protein [Sphaerisporangium sp. TRM90804]|uniref:hypothetical protein n=1 Tax=Sphaerisporangium sp. TRM90804 TaxID=3031113 RepID=UPI00244CE321|nr:hypothetical protein [Sphaerisporangium sp. TRM90804]MDH2428940.1 hypothetical protein [Sphaerisporangium sp. TRM90804]
MSALAAGASMLAVITMSPDVSADTLPIAGELETVTADALPTWQTDGVVLATKVVGDTVYVGGNFDNVRPPGVARGGAGEVPRSNLAAFDVATGALLPWAPTVWGDTFSDGDSHTECDNLGGGQWRCDTVYDIAASPDGSTLYVAGDFDKVDGEWRTRLAAFDAATGALTPFRHTITNRVRAMAVSDSTLYIGGHFTTVDDESRIRLAAFDRADGSLLPWTPSADRRVHAMVLSPSGTRLIIGGDFDRVNGVFQHGLSAVHTADGTKAPFASNDITYLTSTRRSWVTDLVSDGTRVYVSANGEGGGVFDGRLAVNPETGARIWIDNCLGATQAITVMNGVLYSGSHAHYCGSQDYYGVAGFPETRPHRRFLAEPAGTAAGAKQSILHWFPNAQAGTSYPWVQGPWTMDNNGTYLWIGGDFTEVDNVPQEGLTRFTFHSVAPDANGAEQSVLTKPVATANGNGKVTIRFASTWDEDNRVLDYELLRADGSVVCTKSQVASVFWILPPQSCVDLDTPVDSVVKYRVRAIDPWNNRISSSYSADVTVR